MQAHQADLRNCWNMTAARPFLRLGLLGRSLSVLRLLVGVGPFGPLGFQKLTAAIAPDQIIQAVLALVHVPATQGIL